MVTLGRLTVDLLRCPCPSSFVVPLRFYFYFYLYLLLSPMLPFFLYSTG